MHKIYDDVIMSVVELKINFSLQVTYVTVKINATAFLPVTVYSAFIIIMQSLEIDAIPPFLLPRQ